MSIRTEIDALEDRVETLLDRLEKLETFAENESESIGEQLENLETEVEALKAKKADTFDGRCVVPEARILRWEKIERAADQLLAASAPYERYWSLKAQFNSLREALKP